jgi:predicted Fe-Mo cluster-binding NifX family protein
MAKIAFVTDDGRTISAHFGRAARYVIVTVEDGREVGRETVDKFAPHAAEHEHGHHHDHQDHEHEQKHSRMLEPIAGCTAVVARGMGGGAHGHLMRAGITPILTETHTIDEALAAYLAGGLISDDRRLHLH